MPNINDTQPVPVPILGVTTKLIDPNSVPNIKRNITLTQKSPEDIKKEEALHHSYRGYGFKACPYTITTSQGEIRDIWDMPSSVLINKLAQTIIHGDTRKSAMPWYRQPVKSSTVSGWTSSLLIRSKGVPVLR